MDQVKITYSREAINAITTRFAFTIEHESGQRFGFVRFFATITDRDHVVKSRSEIAAALRQEHQAAWERFHYYAE